MKITLLPWAKDYFVRVIPLFIVACITGALGSAVAATSGPVLISDDVSTRAVAFESVTQRPGPFKLTTSMPVTGDNRTRVAIFAMNMNLLPGETANGNPTSFTADAEDAAHVHYSLNVEYVDQVPGFPGIYMIILRLNDTMTSNLGDVLVGLSLHTVPSNRVRVAIGVTGGGPSDDPGAVPTPAPATPPAANPPLTMAEYQALFNNPALAAGPDGLRFLEQATWGPTDSDLTHLRSIGMVSYLNEQFSTPPVFPSVQSDYPATPLYPQFYPGAPAPPCDALCLRDNYSHYPLQSSS